LFVIPDIVCDKRHKSSGRTGYPAQTKVFFASLATLRETVFVGTAWEVSERAYPEFLTHADDFLHR
jgi:hypothetical protein